MQVQCMEGRIKAGTVEQVPEEVVFKGMLVAEEPVVPRVRMSQRVE